VYVKYQIADAAAKLAAKLRAAHNLTAPPAAAAAGSPQRYLNRVRAEGVKFWLDGSIPTALLSKPFTTLPPGETDKNYKGIQNDRSEVLDEWVSKNWKDGPITVAAHALGDGAVEVMIQARARQEGGRGGGGEGRRALGWSRGARARGRLGGGGLQRHHWRCAPAIRSPGDGEGLQSAGPHHEAPPGAARRPHAARPGAAGGGWSEGRAWATAAGCAASQHSTLPLALPRPETASRTLPCLGQALTPCTPVCPRAAARSSASSRSAACPASRAA
jgi:hypothetical protein